MYLCMDYSMIIHWLFQNSFYSLCCIINDYLNIHRLHTVDLIIILFNDYSYNHPIIIHYTNIHWLFNDYSCLNIHVLYMYYTLNIQCLFQNLFYSLCWIINDYLNIHCLHIVDLIIILFNDYLYNHWLYTYS